MDWERDQLIRSLAKQCCDSDGVECRWYHSNWELLTSLGMVTTSAVHARQLERFLASATKASKDRVSVLISGSTDDALLKMASSSFKRLDIDGDFFAIDLCSTPLELMRLHAENYHLNFKSARTNILSYSPETQFDIILAHAFMGNFDEQQRSELLLKWASLLNPGGSIVTIQRVRPADSPPIVQFTPEQSASFISIALDAALEDENFTDSDLVFVEQAARLFTERFMSYSIRSKQTLEELFFGAGLKFRLLEYQKMEAMQHLSGPSVPSGGEYAFIVAEVD